MMTKGNPRIKFPEPAVRLPLREAVRLLEGDAATIHVKEVLRDVGPLSPAKMKKLRAQAARMGVWLESTRLDKEPADQPTKLMQDVRKILQELTGE